MCESRSILRLNVCNLVVIVMGNSSNVMCYRILSYAHTSVGHAFGRLPAATKLPSFDRSDNPTSSHHRPCAVRWSSAPRLAPYARHSLSLGLICFGLCSALSCAQPPKACHVMSYRSSPPTPLARRRDRLVDSSVRHIYELRSLLSSMR